MYRRWVSPMMRRILLVNVVPLALLVATLLYLNQFQNSLLEAEVSALREQARIYAGALGQSAVIAAHRQHRAHPGGTDPDNAVDLSAALARPLLLRLTEPSPSAQARLFAPDGQQIADSRPDAQLPPDGGDGAPVLSFRSGLERLYDRLLLLLPHRRLATMASNADPNAEPEVREQLRLHDNDSTETPPFIRRTASGLLLVTVAEPVAHDGQTVGIIQLTREAREVDSSLFAVRSSILVLFLVALAITVLLSWYLSQTIARPLLRLAASAHVMRETIGRTGSVPRQLLCRKDELGELAQALEESARALWARMDAIERFAADVSHEIKNPLSSIRSAIETLMRIEDVTQQRRLLAIINDDVRRLDRLITDISDASRIDAELSRSVTEPVDVLPILNVLAEINQTTRKDGDPVLSVEAPASDRPLFCLAVEDRLVQVLRNLIGNAVSFSPPNGRIVLEASGTGSMVEIAVSDEGPGIPAAKLDGIFERFYSERPAAENFGTHSGLGLSISRQIVEALRGTIAAENRTGPDGQVAGARFVVRLPRAG
ncbi:sensor histidine kinase [Acetobacteraceae bacterium KSS8]|uniref:histidine kinase n=1 Tax=Endosaccharibacter trunci TaxID=2812733 RepID=A0ABT1W3G5_9PROT|nr:sensor histidine kinase [Acetobacteraceae bacterium KSS8]